MPLLNWQKSFSFLCQLMLTKSIILSQKKSFGTPFSGSRSSPFVYGPILQRVQIVAASGGEKEPAWVLNLCHLPGLPESFSRSPFLQWCMAWFFPTLRRWYRADVVLLPFFPFFILRTITSHFYWRYYLLSNLTKIYYRIQVIVENAGPIYYHLWREARKGGAPSYLL